MRFSVEICNCPEYAQEHDYIIARLFEGRLWFFGAYDDKRRACEIARELGEDALVIEN